MNLGSRNIFDVQNEMLADIHERTMSSLINKTCSPQIAVDPYQQTINKVAEIAMHNQSINGSMTTELSQFIQSTIINQTLEINNSSKMQLEHLLNNYQKEYGQK